MCHRTRYFQGDDEKNTRRISSVMKLIKKSCAFFPSTSHLASVCDKTHIFNGIWNSIFSFIYWKPNWMLLYLHRLHIIVISNIIISFSFALKLLLINKVRMNSLFLDCLLFLLSSRSLLFNGKMDFSSHS